MAARRAYLLDEMRQEFGVTVETMDKAIKKELLFQPSGSSGRRKERWASLLDRLYRRTSPDAEDDEGGQQEKTVHRAVRDLSERNEKLARSIASFLHEATLPSSPFQMELVSKQSGMVQSTLFESQTVQQTEASLQKLVKNDIQLSSCMMTNMHNQDKREAVDPEWLLVDYGLQAAAEQLGVLDNLLRDGSKRHIEAAKRE